MRTSEYYGVQVPELGDRADITVVSQAIIDSEDNQSGKVENMKASLSGSTISLVSECRTDKLVKYYNGLAVQFISPVNAQAGTAYKIKVDNLVEQPYNNKVDIKVGDIVQAIYRSTGFVSANTPIPRSSAVNSDSEVTVATSLAVKNANDNANGRYPYIKYKSSQNVDNIKASGIYSFAFSPTNAGTSTHGTLIVEFNTGTPYQIWIPDNSHIFYKRNYMSSAWGAWSATLGNNISGNANTATRLQTARTINGTSFNGSANITTANWGTARTLTIGGTGKSVNGSANVSWSLSEIGVYSKSEVDSKISAICPYKVGDIFLTTNATNPSTVWLGTTWQKQEGRFLLGSSSSYGLGSTGGASTVKLAVANLPSHTHSASQSAHTHSQPAHTHKLDWNPGYDGGASGPITRSRWSVSGQSSSGVYSAGGDTTGSATPSISIGSTGSGTAFSIMPPYYTVHMWLRVS